MKKHDNSDSDSHAGSSSAQGNRKSQRTRRTTREGSSREASERPNSKISDLPPNENIRKRADEVYGDTEIPERKPGT
jgi:hypothetical protein